MNIRVFQFTTRRTRARVLADHVEPHHQPATLLLRARWRLERAHSAISISRLDEDGRVLMLAAKSNRGTDQGTRLQFPPRRFQCSADQAARMHFR